MSLAFLLTSLIVVATPGTGVIYTISAGLSHGRRAGAVAAVGCTLGILPHLVATISGVAALLHTSAVAFQTVRYLGVAYLLFMAWRTYRERDALVLPESEENAEGAQKKAPRSAAKVITSGILVNILNPKLTVFFIAFLPQFVSTGDQHALPRMLALSGVFMLLTLLVFLGYGLVASAMRDQVIARPKVTAWMRRIFAGSFLVLGAKLALD